MSVYFVVNGTVTDRATLDGYVNGAMATLGIVPLKLLALDEGSETVEGKPAGSRTVILEFESKEDFQKWYESPEYQAILPDRLKSTDGFGVLVEGMAAT